jgi:iron complex outermembrane recepter protein
LTRTFVTLATIAPFFMAFPAVAQDEPQSRGVEEIIVTAQKRAENVQDVPISVAAFSGEALDLKGAGNPSDLQKLTPGLTYSTAVGFSILYLRGIGSDAFLMADPSVTLYIDGIYFPFAQGLAQSFGAVERVEVLKGPQGTLFGRNAVGGAINIVTKDPGDEPEVSAQLGYGKYDQFQGRLHLSAPFAETAIPFGDTLAASVSTFYEGEDNYYDGSSHGRALPDEISKGIRAKLKWTPLESVSVTAAAFHFEHGGPGSLVTPNSDPSLVGQVGGIQPNLSYHANMSSPVFSDLDNTVYYGQASWLTSWFDLKALGSDQDIQTSYGYDYDGSPQPLVGFGAENQYADVKTGEFQILSNDTTWLSDWVTWIAGTYYFTSRQGFDPVDFGLADLNLATGEAAGLQLPQGLVDALVGLGLGPVIPTGHFPLRSLIDTDSIAGFGQATIDLTSWFSLTGGARYQIEKRTVVASSSSIELIDGQPISLADFSDGRNETTTSLKPKISLEFRPLDDVMLYASFQQAIKSGTYNVVTLYDAPDFVKPEDLDAWEIGAKTTLLGGLLSLNAAGFWYELKNQQVQFQSIAQAGAVNFENAGETRIYGADFDLRAQLVPQWIDDLVLTASGAYLNGEYTDYTGGRGYDEMTGLAFEDGNFTGNRAVRTPKFSGIFGLAKAFTFGSHLVEIASDVYTNSGFFFTAQNDPGSFQDSYEVVDARLSYLYEPWGVRVTAWGKNLNDAKYIDGQFQTDFGFNSHLGRPVKYGIRLNWDF